MEYLKVIFTIESIHDDYQTISDLITDFAGEAGCEAFEDVEGQVIGYAQPHLLDREMIEEGIKDFPIPDVRISFHTEKAENKNWNEAWENAGFEPIYIENQCIIYDAKHTDVATLSPIIPLKIGIETKQAFGTGGHETTRMIITQLLRSDLHDKKVLDCGCGTGILGIVASKLGAKEIVAYDIDEWSTENTIHNARLNGINNITVYQGDATVLDAIENDFDILLANINRNILLADMQRFNQKMHKDSLLVLSGFYAEDIPLLLQKAKELKMHETHRDIRENWACVVVRKKLEI